VADFVEENEGVREMVVDMVVEIEETTAEEETV
jgi:hypothetical protein